MDFVSEDFLFIYYVLSAYGGVANVETIERGSTAQSVFISPQMSDVVFT